MKTNLTFMSAIMLAFVSTSCTKSNIEDDSSFGIDPSKISFRSTTSKANDNSLTELKGGFNIIATNQSGAYIDGFTAPAGSNVTYFFDAGATPAAWDWKDQATKGDKIWPMQDTSYPLTFFAAYPLSSTITKDATSTPSNVISNLTSALFPYNTYNNGTPIAFDATKVTIDELASLTSVTRRPVTGFADLNFKHIMSNMKFNVTVPANHEAYIQSIKIANANKSGRSYDYKTGLWSAEVAYVEANNAHYAHFISSAGQPAQVILNSAGAVDGLSDGASGFNTLKLMPQKTVTTWALGTETTPAAGTFRADAAAWKASLADGIINAAAITKWHTQNTSAQGMLNSDGWKGTRIEVIYCLVDKSAGAGKEKNVIGAKSGISGAGADLMVRVGYPLDLKTLNANTGWEAGKRYTFNIPLGTADASNGILLDPDYKSNNGTNTDKPVDNPQTEPGQAITRGGLIEFNVKVDDWVDAPGVVVN